MDEVLYSTELAQATRQAKQNRKRLRKVVKSQRLIRQEGASIATAESVTEDIDEGVDDLRRGHDSFVTKFFDEEGSRRHEQILQIQTDLGHFHKVLSSATEWFNKALRGFPEASTDPDAIATLKVLREEALGEAGRAMNYLDDYLSNLSDLETVPRKHYGYYLHELESAMANIARNSSDLSLSVKGFLEYTAHLKKD